MKVEKLYQNAALVTDKERKTCDIGVSLGKIVMLEEVCNRRAVHAEEIIDLQNQTVIPGMIDPHVHLQDPGYTCREDFTTGTMAAAAGGVTTVLSHPLNLPPAVDTASYRYTYDCYQGRGIVDYGIHGGVTGGSIAECKRLWETTGATSIKLFMCRSVAEFPPVEEEKLAEVFQIAGTIGALLMVHAEDNQILEREEAALREAGRKDAMAHVEAHPQEAETKAIQKVIELLAQYDAAAVILHVSTARGLELIHRAREQGVHVWAETAPHLLTFTDCDILRAGPYLKFTPVMHDEANRQKMWRYVKQGYVQEIGSDHSPYTKQEKDAGFADIRKAPNGIPGIQTCLPVLLNAVNEGRLTLEQVVEMTSANTAKIYGIYPRKGCLAVGSDADFTVLDMQLKKALTPEAVLSKCKDWSPYFGLALKGWPVMTVVRGKAVYDHGKITGEIGYGSYVPRIKQNDENTGKTQGTGTV